MNQVRPLYLAIVVILGGISQGIADEQQSRSEIDHAPLVAVTRLKSEIFASNRFGLFQCNDVSKQWTRLHTPAEMPAGGRFGTNHADETLLVYYISLYGAPERDEYQFGIYVSNDQGTSWDLVSEHPHYRYVLLTTSGVLFAIANNKVLESHDMGKTWREIYSDSMTVFSIFEDPDHPDLVCLRGYGLRGYVLQASDDRYAWNKIREGTWYEKHPLPFFRQRYFVTHGGLHHLPATLSNYFQYDFSNQIDIPSFELTTGVRRISVSQNAKSIRVPATIRFHSRNDVAKQKETIVTLIDSLTSCGAWRICVEHNGEQISKSAPVIENLRHQVKDRDAKRKQILGEDHWKSIELSPSKEYHREIDLSQLFEFRDPGTYKVQLIFDNSWQSGPQASHWCGSFASSVFEVVVTDEE